MTAGERWLRERLDGAPPRLVEAMVAALPPDPSASVADDLAGAAVGLLARVAEGGGYRDEALPLLAADALLTHAMEAQAEADVEGLAAFVARWGAAGRLGELASAREPTG